MSGDRLIKNSFFTLFNSLFMTVTTWVVSIWVARALGPHDYGIFNFVLWFSGTVSGIIGMGLVHAATKYIAEYQGRNQRQLILPIVVFILKTELLIALPVTAVLIFLRSQVADYFFSPDQSFFFFLAALGLVPGIITAIFSATIEGIQKFEYFTVSNLIITPLSFAGKVWVLLQGKGITGLLVVMLICSFLNTLFYLIVIIRESKPDRNSPRLSDSIKRRIGSYNRNVLAIILCDKIVWDKSENYFLGRFCSASEIGFYNMGFNFAQKFTSILPNTFWRVLFPAMSGYFGSGDHEKMKRLFHLSTRYLAFFSFPTGAAVAILSFQIIKYLPGIEYLAAQRVLQIIAVASVFSSLSKPASAILYGFEKLSFIYKYGAALAVFNIALDLLLIIPFGATGAAVCYALTTVFGSVGGLVYTCSTMKISYPFVSLVKILFSTIIMAVVMEIIIMKDGSIVSLVISVLAGAVTYLTCSFSLGTFCVEDYHLLGRIRDLLPGKTKKLADFAINTTRQFKCSAENKPVQDERSGKKEKELRK
ncbi:MAG: lipopolysaccharide biosynthesis protein [Chitinispirillaceae bacterium]